MKCVRLRGGRKVDMIDDDDDDDDDDEGVSVPANQWTFALGGVQCK